MRSGSEPPRGDGPAGFTRGRLKTYEGAASGGGRTVCILVSRFNSRVTERLLEGAARTAFECGVAEEDVDVVYVPGAWELPPAARRAAARGYAAIVALGCVIRGETAHFDHVGRAATDGLAKVQLDSGVPVGLGVLTPDTMEQALARAGGELGNAGSEAARAALRMADLNERLGA
ncbi:6,7-dimethyl-8-ribityllumazine synthase [Candidatus Palauibacter irciniicola]|uniref:6,7-dimethyl-8-ribityllumazine synthase n=1 Tax=Candidatus Palauibacter irciniicola TaxID=3056733 RepID=UPI003B025638